jgi:hypothetical protein
VIAYEEATKEQTGSDLWDQLQPQLILRMDKMLLEDLINLMWSALHVGKGSDTFFNEVDKNIRKRIYKIKDEDFQTMIGCVTNDNVQPVFAEKFLNIVLRVINEKKDTF